MTLEPGIFLDLDRHQQVARRSALRPGIAPAREPQKIIGRHAGRSLDRDLLVAPQATLAVALIAPALDDPAIAAALRAGAHAHELTEHGALNRSDFAGPGARAAGDGNRAGLGAAPFTALAALEEPHAERFLCPCRGLGESDSEPHSDIAAASRSGAASLLEEIPKGASATKLAHEDVEGVGEVESAHPGARAGAAADSGFAVPIVEVPLLRIAQHLISLRDGLEPGLGVVRVVAVGMILHRQLAVGLLDLLGARLPGDSQHVVVVCHLSSGKAVSSAVQCCINRETREDVQSTTATTLS